ncbi:hypothetical protein [Spirosoma sp. KUDC1026]|uniref:hypothetical protein n=1 Tax=Spirosoma sp. KUDC1026 TaxID=2745947 RepID=UPI00159B9D39|nr:hypothetical protein [Spirosoma sp. KUDC1026]QKZ12780.1 hypothetical protein HU175_09105 [Spirosoma sp. KUDC1026]
MAIDQHAFNLVDTTVNTFNGSAVSVSPIDGITLIDSWISALPSDEQSADSITTKLGDLRTELRNGSPDGSHIRQLLTDLAQQAKQAADTADSVVQTKLKPLVDSLEGFSQRLGGSGEQPQAGSQAPMTSTVGGESTNSGVGTSAIDSGTGDTRLTGGTTSNGPAASIGMDDTTGSDGGNESTTSTDAEPDNTEEGDYRSGDADDTKEEDNQSADTSDARRTESRSVGGMGVSGGTGDSATAQSQGRSQY